MWIDIVYVDPIMIFKIICVVGCPRIEKGEKRDIPHQTICKVPQTQEGNLLVEDGKRHGVLWAPKEEKWHSGEIQWVVGSYLKGHTYHLCIKCLVANLSTAFMRRWPLNSVFTTSNPFYHLQQSLDGTSIRGRVLGRTRGRSWYKEIGYIRRKKLWDEETFFGGGKIKRKRKKNSVQIEITSTRLI